MKIFRNLTKASILFAAMGCMQPAAGNSPADSAHTGNVVLTAEQKDWAAVVALENQAKTIAKAAGCATTAQCRSAPVGNRGCGGPRYYLAYCAATTDSVALFRKLDEVKAAENAYNKKYNVISTCEFRMPPAVALINGACAAQ